MVCIIWHSQLTPRTIACTFSCSNEAGGGSRTASVDKTPWPSVVRPTIVCHFGGWTLRGADMADVKSQEQMKHSDYSSTIALLEVYFVCMMPCLLNTHTTHCGPLFLNILCEDLMHSHLICLQSEVQLFWSLVYLLVTTHYIRFCCMLHIVRLFTSKLIKSL